jgi:hypothetical protein
MSLHTTESNNNKRYLTVAEGRLREKVQEGTEGATFRQGTLKDGAAFSKWELVYPGITAFITEVKIKKGTYGKEVNIYMTDETDEEFIVQLNATARNTGVKFLSVLPNIDMTKPVTIKPHGEFKAKDGKEILAGMSIQQDGTTLKSAFFDGEKNLLGMPSPEVDKRTKEVDWDSYWPIRDKFLQDYLLDNGFATYDDGSQSSSVEEVKTDDESF